jgi:hypothetical protein
MLHQARLPTTGGDITILGSNFGAGLNLTEGVDMDVWLSQSGRSVSVGGFACPIASWNDSCIVCRAPQGVAAVRAEPHDACVQDSHD